LKERNKFFKTSYEEYNNEKVDLVNSVEMLAEENKRMSESLEESVVKHREEVEMLRRESKIK